jgi:hypothetical protein
VALAGVGIGCGKGTISRLGKQGGEDEASAGAPRQIRAISDLWPTISVREICPRHVSRRRRNPAIRLTVPEKTMCPRVAFNIEHPPNPRPARCASGLCCQFAQEPIKFARPRVRLVADRGQTSRRATNRAELNDRRHDKRLSPFAPGQGIGGLREVPDAFFLLRVVGHPRPQHRGRGAQVDAVFTQAGCGKMRPSIQGGLG